MRINKKIKSIINVFILTNVIAFLVVESLPASAQSGSKHALYFLNALFVLCVISSSLVTYFCLKSSKINGRAVAIKANNSIVDKLLLNKNTNFISWIVLIGFLLIAIDRIYIREIDYSVGFRVARYEWLDSTGGNPFGILGNLAIAFSYIGILLLVMRFKSIENKSFLLLSIIIGVLGHAALNGGRSNLLLALIVLVIGMILRRKDGVEIKFLSKNFFLLIGISVIGVLYVAGIIESSASLGAVDLNTLLILGIESLYGTPSEELYANGNSKLYNIIVYGLSYLYHGQWTAQISLSLENREGNYSLAALPIIMLNDAGLLGLSFENKAFSETGAFVSLPGAFYYDFGWFGVIFLSLLVGVALSIVFHLVERNKGLNAFQMAYVTYFLFVLILSPILPAHGLAYLNIIIFAFIIFHLLNRMLFRAAFRF